MVYVRVDQCSVVDHLLRVERDLVLVVVVVELDLVHVRKVLVLRLYLLLLLLRVEGKIADYLQKFLRNLLDGSQLRCRR